MPLLDQRSKAGVLGSFTATCATRGQQTQKMEEVGGSYWSMLEEEEDHQQCLSALLSATPYAFESQGCGLDSPSASGVSGDGIQNRELCASENVELLREAERGDSENSVAASPAESEAARATAAAATLELVLNSDQFMQELHAKETALIRFLSSPVVISELVRLLTVLPGEDASFAQKFSSPYYAAEVFCSHASPVILALLTDPSCAAARDAFWNFLANPAPLNPVLAGYFSRCWQSIVKAHPEEAVNYLASLGDAPDALARHLYSRSIADLYKCILYVEQCIPTLIEPSTIIPTLFQLLKHSAATRPSPRLASEASGGTACSPRTTDARVSAASPRGSVQEPSSLVEVSAAGDAEANQADVMCGLEGQVCVTLVARELIYQRLFISYFPVLLRDLTSERVLLQLIDMVTSECASCVSSGVSILTDLLCCTCVGDSQISEVCGGPSSDPPTLGALMDCTDAAASEAADGGEVAFVQVGENGGEERQISGAERDAETGRDGGAREGETGRGGTAEEKQEQTDEGKAGKKEEKREEGAEDAEKKRRDLESREHFADRREGGLGASSEGDASDVSTADEKREAKEEEGRNNASREEETHKQPPSDSSSAPRSSAAVSAAARDGLAAETGEIVGEEDVSSAFRCLGGTSDGESQRTHGEANQEKSERSVHTLSGEQECEASDSRTTPEFSFPVEDETLAASVVAKEDRKWIEQLEAGEFVELYIHPHVDRLMAKLTACCGFEEVPSDEEVGADEDLEREHKETPTERVKGVLPSSSPSSSSLPSLPSPSSSSLPSLPSPSSSQAAARPGESSGGLSSASIFRPRWRLKKTRRPSAGVARLANGVFPAVGMETLELLTLVKSLLKSNAVKTASALLERGVLDLAVELLFLHPWNTLLHLTVTDMLQSLLHRGDSEGARLLLRTRLVPLLVTHFQRKRGDRESARRESSRERLGSGTSTEGDRRRRETDGEDEGEGGCRRGRQKKERRETCGYTAHLLQVAQLVGATLEAKPELMDLLPLSWQQQWEAVVGELLYYQQMILNEDPGSLDLEEGALTTLPAVRTLEDGFGGSGVYTPKVGFEEEEGGDSAFAVQDACANSSHFVGVASESANASSSACLSSGARSLSAAAENAAPTNRELEISLS
ncbi:SIT4 phosphatase-associated protein [Toxoplasma gondii RUB]|uniref:SIT4 phosphatase-associated protein n=1 Tax=Toxoplasma gondii RUB TaxID=935652 RepID=A0A086LQ03_TOXGO|nr:SIT4 phosphatase-associated protein [Toxoplasma gondii RUB]